MKFQACTSIDEFIASAAKIVDNGNRVVYDIQGSYIENKTSGKRHPLVRNWVNGPWY